MKKGLLIMMATFMVAISANAQFKRTVQPKMKATPIATGLKIKKANDKLVLKTVTPVKDMKTRRAAEDINGTYILDYDNYHGDFTASSSFTIVAETGTTKIIDMESENLEETIDFNYNVRLEGFTYSNGIAYGYYDEEDGFIGIPVQTIYTHNKYGRVVLSGVTKNDDGPQSIGFDMGLIVEDDGTISFYDFEEELAEAGLEGEYMSGWYSFLPDLPDEESGAWNMGFDVELLPVNAYTSGDEVHIVNGDWGDWTETQHFVSVEDYGTELVVHNFFDLCPISITIDGDKASIATPVQVDDYDYAEEGEDPNYIQIWQWNADFTQPLNPGAITGTVSTTANGSKVIRFYDTEYREAYTDEKGIEHEAGNYIVSDRSKYFMVHSTYGENGAIFWGEACYISLVIPNDMTGINEVKTNMKGNAMTYNMMGQQVSKSAKGLLIRDGKKFIVK